MYKRTFLIIISVLVAFLLFGCSENDSSSGITNSENGDKTSDDSSISSVITEENGVPDDIRNYDDYQEPLDEIFPVRFGRQVTSRTIQTEIEYVDEDHAQVTRSQTIEGIFHILTEDSVHVEKPFTDNSIRYYDLYRFGDRKGRHRGWRIVSTSGTEFWSDDNTVEIVQMQIQAGDVDTIITDVSTKIPRNEILTLPPDTEVTITVTTLNEDDQLFLHKRGPGGRIPYESNGDGTYTVTFNTPEYPRPRPFHIMIDALSYGTLFDDELPYDSNGWGIHFKVRP